MNLPIYPLLIWSAIICISLPGCVERGCTDPSAHNYDESATMDDGSCLPKYTPSVVSIDGDPLFKVTIDDETWASTDAFWPNAYGYKPYLGIVTSPEHHHKTGGYFVHTDSDEIHFGMYRLWSTAASGINSPDFPRYTRDDFTLGQQNLYVDGGQGSLVDVYEFTIYQHGKFFSTRWGNQDNSELTIVDVKNGQYNGFNVVRVLFNISCTVYNLDNPSEMKSIRNGKALILFER